MTASMLNHALQASFADTSDQRASDRRMLRLEARVATAEGEGGVQVHNLSRTGMLIEGDADIAVGSTLEVELSTGDIHQAEIVWRDEGLLGCRFARPLPQATLSAALLRSAPQSPPKPLVSAERARNEAMERLQRVWASEASPATQSQKLGLGTRMWIIGGLGLAGWAVPAAAAWLLF